MIADLNTLHPNGFNLLGSSVHLDRLRATNQSEETRRLRKEAADRRWAKDGERERQSARLADPIVKAARSAAMRTAWANDKFKLKMSAALRASRDKKVATWRKTMADPAKRAALKERLRKQLADPDIEAKRVAGLRSAARRGKSRTIRDTRQHDLLT